MESKQPSDSVLPPLFLALVAGLFFFIAIIKFGSPVIMDRYVEAPRDFASILYGPWPPHWGMWFFVPIALIALIAFDLRRLKLRWALGLPLLWLAWQCVAATRTMSPSLTELTLLHFAICVGLFYIGFFAGKAMDNPWPVWVAMGLALCWTMRAGLEQHFGGLEATRKLLAQSPQLTGLDAALLGNPDYLKRIQSDRIFGTFGGYPNSLAAAIMLLLPLTLVFMWRLTPKVRASIRIGFVLVLGGCGLGCLYWTGSKAGWLLALGLGLVALGHSPLSLKWRRGVICGMLVLGIAGFGLKYAGFFHKQYNSVDARFGYWHGAMIVIRHHPWLGTGPGTFQIPYERIKRSTDEMARLCHNDYLEQASDSGIFSLLIFTGMIFTALISLYRYSVKKAPLDWFKFAVWLGVLGVCLHSFVDFNLYIPALAWPVFFLFGWLFRQN